jgi:hypothetical protein
MNVLNTVSPTPLHAEPARAAGQADDASQDLLEVVGGVAATVAGVVAAFSVGPVGAAMLPVAAGSVGPIGGSTLLATALSVGSAAASALPAIACSPEIGALAVVEGRGLDDALGWIESSVDDDNGAGTLSKGLDKGSAELRDETPTNAKPGLHDLSVTKVVDKASNPMMSMQAGAAFVPDGGLHPAVDNAVRVNWWALAAKEAEAIRKQERKMIEESARK